MNWNHCFAARTAQMQRSAIRELLKLTAQPDMISFAGGVPSPGVFPMLEVQEAVGRVLSRHGTRALQYGETEGVSELRDWIAQHAIRRNFSGAPLTRSNVAIVSGAQQALDLLGRIFLNPNDRVAVENPTYLAALSAWRPFGVRFVPFSAGGALGIDSLTARFARETMPKLLYVVPNFQNPSGSTLTLAHRRALLALSREHALPLIEDDPYGELRYEGEPLPHLLELDYAETAAAAARCVIYAGTFSKVLSPGLRIGWIVGPEPVIDKVVQAKQAADLHTSTLNQLLACELVSDGLLERHVPKLREAYRIRRDAMLHALERYFPDEASWTRPEGGFFLLVTLPQHVDAAALLSHALRRNVAFVPGADFHVDGSGTNTLRLSFSTAAPELIEEGIQRLGNVLKEVLHAA